MGGGSSSGNDGLRLDRMKFNDYLINYGDACSIKETLVRLKSIILSLFLIGNSKESTSVMKMKLLKRTQTGLTTVMVQCYAQTPTMLHASFLYQYDCFSLVIAGEEICCGA